MSPITRKLVLDFADLRFVSVECHQCKTEVVFDAGDAKNGVPTRRPTCNHEYDALFCGSLTNYRDFYRNFSKSSYRVRPYLTVAEGDK